VTLATVEIAYFQNQDLLVQARFAYLQAAVSLYQAVGGGWSQRRARSKSRAPMNHTKPTKAHAVSRRDPSLNGAGAFD